MTDNNRLERLAAFASLLGDPRTPFARPTALVGKGTEDDPYVFGTGGLQLTELGNEFQKMVYEAGWILAEFDWQQWEQTQEGRLLMSAHEELARANDDELARVLTVCVRRERFVEGSLAEAFDNNFMLAIAKRAEVLARVISDVT